MPRLSLQPVLIVVGLSALAALPAQAQSLTGNVGSAAITAGDSAAEVRFGINSSDQIDARLHYEFAPSEWYQLRVIGAFNQPGGADWDFSALTLENWLQWADESSDGTGFNGGIRFAYSFADDGPDEVETRLTLTDRFTRGWEWRANLIGEMEAGDGSEGGINLESRLQLTRALDFSALGSNDWRLGVEAFSEFGNSRDIPGLDEQAHQIGPVIKAAWENGLFVQSALRFGVTSAADDTMFKVFVGREF